MMNGQTVIYVADDIGAIVIFTPLPFHRVPPKVRFSVTEFIFHIVLNNALTIVMNKLVLNKIMSYFVVLVHCTAQTLPYCKPSGLNLNEFEFAG